MLDIACENEKKKDRSVDFYDTLCWPPISTRSKFT